MQNSNHNTKLTFSRDILRSLRSVYFLKNHKGEYIWISKELESRSSFKAESVIGKTDHDMPWSHHIEYIEKMDRSCKDQDYPQECTLYEFNLYASENISFKLPWREGEEEGVCGLSIETSIMSQDHIAALRAFTHDMRLPITSITGNLQICNHLLKKQNLNGALEMVDRANRGVIALLGILDHFKYLGKNLAKITFKVFPVIQSEVDMAQALINPNQEVEIFYNISSSVPIELSLELYAFQQIIRNLLSNAVKFTRYGKITFKLDLIQEDLASYTHHNSMHTINRYILLVSISDTGIGLSEQVKTTLSEIAQMEMHDIENYGGMQIIWKNIKKLGGDMQFFSDSKGSTFECRLPYAMKRNTCL